MVVALVPIALALTSWDPAGAYNQAQAWFRLYGIAAIVAELAVIVYSVVSGADPLRPVIHLPLWAKAALAGLIGVAGFTSFFVAPDPLRATSWTFFSVVHVVFGLAVASLVRNFDSTTRLASWRAILAGVSGYLLLVVVFVAIAIAKHSLKWEYFGLGVTNIRQVGFYSAIGAGASLGLAAVETGPRRHVFYVVMAALMLSLSFWSGTRGSLFAVFVAFSMGAVLLRELRSIRSWLALAGGMAGGAALSLIGPLPNALFGIVRLKAASGGDAADVSSGRFDMWIATWHAILERPLTGYGAGQYFVVVQDNLGSFNHPHNILLQVLFQWGFVGAACYCALAVFLTWRAFTALRNPQPADAPALLVGISLLTMSLYEGALFHSYPTMMIAFALTFIIAPRRETASVVP